MLNISPNSVADRIDRRKFSSLRIFLDYTGQNRQRKQTLLVLFTLMVLFSVLPWTQNIQAPGRVTSLQPENRPQALESRIDGRIEKWYVQEGDYVTEGDTLIKLSEIKDRYFDPQLVERTEDQIRSKEAGLESYRAKTTALESQIQSLKNQRNLKLQQSRNKIEIARLQIQADSMNLLAAITQEAISVTQRNRADTMYRKGLYSKTQWEARRQKAQEARSKRIALESKLLSTRNMLLNAQMEIESLQAQYAEKISKAESDKQSALSNLFSTQAELSKLENSLSNYRIRRSNYYLTAPQDGYFTQAISNGLGVNVKQGTTIATIMPGRTDLAVEMRVRPIDLPLVNIGQGVRIQFDGWPAFFFSGWPGVSFGTFGAKVVAIDRFTGPKGKYRVLLAPDPQDVAWPDELRVGAGALTFTMLEDVPIWYEIWRQINGFPPEFYKAQNATKNITPTGKGQVGQSGGKTK